MVELSHPLSTHLMLAEKHIKTLGVLGIYRHIISITYRIDKYYENIFDSIFDPN